MLDEIPILYSFRRCPFAIRARSAIYFSQMKVEIREVLLRDKPKEMLTISPKGTVPILQLKDKIIDESIEIMLWALNIQDKYNVLESYKNNKNSFFELVNKFDHGFKYHLDRYKYSSRYIKEGKFLGKIYHRDKALEYLIELENLLLNKSNYLFKDKLTISDLSLFPLVRQFKITDQEWFENNKNLTKTNKWLDNLINSIFFNKVMYKYSLWNKDTNKKNFQY